MRVVSDTYQGYVRVVPETYQGYVRVVPSIVVHERRPVGHACYLVPIVPPGHDARVLVRVLTQPVVRLTEVVKNVPSTVGETGQLVKGCGCGTRKFVDVDGISSYSARSVPDKLRNLAKPA